MSFSRLAFAATVLVVLAALAFSHAAGPEYLASTPLPPRPAKGLAVGEVVRTAAGERRRIDLPAGSLLLNEKTALKRSGERDLELSSGEVFVTSSVALTVRAPGREVKGNNSCFAVRTDTKDSTIVAASGRVHITGVEGPLTAGQQLAAGEERPSAGPRVSQVLSWTRELMTDGMVPASNHQGGSLIVLDADRQEQRLGLRRYHVDVHVEDGFARTTIDQTYFNHTHSRQEGTFRFPLPPDASLSRLAMYVDGKLNEGGMVEKDYGRMVYERIKYEQRDPALLEWIDGSTFSMRVFPLEPRQEKRILLSYTQRLGSLSALASYRFPAGHDLTAKQFSVHVRVKDGATSRWQSTSHSFTESKDGGDLVLDTSAKGARINRDIVLDVAESKPKAEARLSSAEHEGFQYLMLRCRLPLPSEPKRAPRDWVFLFESGGDRDPVLARTQIEIIRSMLEAAGPEDRFSVLTANTRVYRWSHRWPVPITPRAIDEAVTFLERSHLIGALDLGQALKLEALVRGDMRNAWLVHVGSGIAAMGERRDGELVRRIPAGTHYVGVGVGRRWNRSFMKLAAEKTGGYFTQINPDEPVFWRAFDLAATLDTPRLLNIKVADRDGKIPLLPFTSVVAQGEELAAVARQSADEKLPETVVASGTLDGKPYWEELRIGEVKAKAGYLPRTWAKLEIERLLEEDATKHKQRIVELSKAMYVMTPFTSLLVLENEEMYQQFKVDRGRKDHWALYLAPERIDVVCEPEDGPPFDPHKGIKPSLEQVRKTLVVRDAPRVLRLGQSSRPGPHRMGGGGQLPDASDWLAASGEAAMEDVIKTREAVPEKAVLQANLALLMKQSREEEDENAPVSSMGLSNGRLPPGFRLIEVHQRKAGEGREDGRVLLKKVHLTVTKPVLSSSRVSDGPPIHFPPAAAWLDYRNATPDIQDQVADFASATLGSSGAGGHYLYTRKRYHDDDRLYFNLLAYAPGLNTTSADILAVLQEEALIGAGGRRGEIDPGAKDLFAAARNNEWRSLTLPSTGDGAWTISFTTAGQYTWERRLPSGLQEKVTCDGETLWHAYPELGLAARRKVSGLHHVAFARLVPWALPSAADLAYGADLRLRGENVVAVVPHGAGTTGRPGKPRSYRELHFVFAKDGSLAGRRLVEMPSEKTLLQEELTPYGTLRRRDGDGKEIAVIKGALSAAMKPNLKPDIADLVVVPLPYRTPGHVRDKLGATKRIVETLTFEDGRALLAAEVAAGNGDGALALFRQCFHRRDQRQIGYYVLLAACGQNLDAEHNDVLAEHRDSPLAQYLALYTSPVLRKHASDWAVASNSWGDGLFQRLAVAHSLCQRWSSERTADVTKATELNHALAFVRQHKGSAFGWAVLGLVADRAADAERSGRPVRVVQQALAEVWPLFADVPALHYSARYEEARSLSKAGEGKRAAKLFLDLYEEALATGALPAFDGDFRSTLLEAPGAANAWSTLLRSTSDRLVRMGDRGGLLALSRQCWQIGDVAAAQRTYDVLRANLPIGKDHVALLEATLDFLEETGQWPGAEELLRAFLSSPSSSKDPRVLRRAYNLAKRRNMPQRELEHLEALLEQEFEVARELVNLVAVRNEYSELLERYEAQAKAVQSLGLPLPSDFQAKVVRIADRWRALDPENDHPCRMSARIFQVVGNSNKAWDYLTTPISHRPNEAGPWTDLAATLAQEGEWNLADSAYAAACEADPTNAQVLWDRARNLTQAGRPYQAQPLYHRLAEGPWPPQYRGLQEQARLRAANR